MTHPTIEAANYKLENGNVVFDKSHPVIEAATDAAMLQVQEPPFSGTNAGKREMQRQRTVAAARAILSAPVSDAEVEAALVANYGKAWAKFAAGVQDAARKTMRAAITATLAQRLKQLEGCV